MRIREVRIFGKSLPVKGVSYRMARATVSHLESTIVQLIADDGTAGWGETCPIGSVYQPHHVAGARAALTEVAPGLIEIEDVTPRRAQRAMDERLSGHGYAKAAIDIAVLDLLGRRLGVPVSQLLGGALVDRVPSYYSTTVGDPGETARIAREKRDQGYPRLQIKIGGRPLEADIETVRKVWEAVGYSARIAVDANRGLTARDAVLLSQQCRDVPFVFEQPCNTMDEVIGLRGRVLHPVYLDENAEDPGAILRAVTTCVADGFGLKVTRIGGLSAMTAVRDICAIRSLPHTCDDAWGGDIIAAACVHIGATVDPRLFEGAWIAAEYIDGHYDAENPVAIDGGHIRVPQGPGLGVAPAEGAFGDPIATFA